MKDLICNHNGTDLQLQSSLARKRWKILAKALRGSKSTETCQDSASVRRFQSFGLLTTKFLRTDEKGAVWFRYQCQYLPTLSFDVRHLPGTVEAKTLLGFNNTGNVCVWPSEEIMAYYCLKSLDQFQNKSICELGGGMTCLAGLAVAAGGNPSEVLVTDGNEQSVENLEFIIEKGKQQSMFHETTVHSRLTRWGEGYNVDSDWAGHFDYVLCADCLFFDEGREDLSNLVWSLLKPQGTAIMFAPSRNKTFDKFVKLVSGRFDTQVTENYDDVVWKLHQNFQDSQGEVYDENLHYPFQLILKKPCAANGDV